MFIHFTLAWTLWVWAEDYISLSLKFFMFRASLVTQMVKNLPEMLEIQAQSLGWEDPLEKGMATHSDILA